MSYNNSESLGICIGASTVSSVWIKKRNGKSFIEKVESIAHYGHPKSVITDIFKTNSSTSICVTGRKFRSLLNLTSISEPEAIEMAFEFINKKADLIVSVGGENFIVYELDEKGKITKPITGNKCASGTGEFFLQQIKRMNLQAAEAVDLALQGKPYNISGRCSVFCKSDCTHALNKGVAKADVVAGLSKMMAQKIIELSSKSKHTKVLLIGGVSKNKALLNFLREQLDDINAPQEAAYFEALGAALYALKNKTIALDKDNLFREESSSFDFHPRLKDFRDKVTFKTLQFDDARYNDRLILGLDVGSTTTKAVLLREEDNAIIASEYLRTNGDPVGASIECYKSLANAVNIPVKIIGLGVTGSGRYISGLHAQTKGIINEIIAHAAATVFFDEDVDTIFEIGGQDAKYTHITAGVPSDYAMNEACSAGTGSFLEEAAKESLNVDYRDIGDIALQADRAPNFNDQCSAFISSDIKNALHEGLSNEEIIAGLVYSICLNYTNRVKGNRPVGNKVFMQGGVCYNKAVPIAMAALTGKEIIVPPHPGLMGAFGVAMEIKKRLELKLIDEQTYELDELINRQVEYVNNFVCAGGQEKCDRKCGISMVLIDGKKFPFGGSCNKYYNLQSKTKVDVISNNLVKIRQDLVFSKYLATTETAKNGKTIGISKSFLTNSLYPLYYNFFTQAGFDVVLADTAKPQGIKLRQAAFCYPVELAHGFMQDLIDKKPDYIFIPHVLELYNKESEFKDKACVLLQSETYYLKTAFKSQLQDATILSPILNFADGYDGVKKVLVEMSRDLKISKTVAAEAFDFALDKLLQMFREFKEIGKRTIEQLEQNPDMFAIVLLGRAYSAFAKEANLAIPQKIATRNIIVIPHDFLSTDQESSNEHMYWGMGRRLLRAARFVEKHPQLYAAWVTNFSCGPDSFLLGYFRNIMGQKPSLTLELDSHSADAGINTRVEAFIDIVKSYRQLGSLLVEANSNDFRPLQIGSDQQTIIDSNGEEVSIFDPSVKLLIPNMGKYVSEGIAAAFCKSGVNASALPVYNSNVLKVGRGHSTCKECLPLQLTAGSMVNHYMNHRADGEKTLFFMAMGDGPCRLGQYHVFLKELIKKRELRDIGVYSLTDEDNFSGFDENFNRRTWESLVIGDVMQSIELAIEAIAVDKIKAREILNKEWTDIVNVLKSAASIQLLEQLKETAANLAKIEKKCSFKSAPKIALIGEIFVRNDEFSRMNLIQKLSDNGIIVKVAPVVEYLHYANYIIRKGQTTIPLSFTEKVKFRIREAYQKKMEQDMRQIMALSGLCDAHVTEIDSIIDRGKRLVNPALTGETILTIGSALEEILDHVSGVISIGPFGCMPSRVAESILAVEMNIAGKMSTNGKDLSHLQDDINELPFLAIETDGNPFPQIIQSRVEIFLLQTKRLHAKLQNIDLETRKSYTDSFKKILYLYGNGYKTKITEPQKIEAAK